MAKIKVLSFSLVLLMFAGITLFGCSDSWQGTSSQTIEQTQNDTGINVLTSVFPSPKEQNPYSVENMNKTFKSLVLANNTNAKDIPKLKANFLYVRFLPYGKQGVYELKAYDTSLVLFKHPMDYNKIRKPVVYMDKTLPDSIIPYFASVPVGYEFGSTPYEILQELFLTQPLEDDDEKDYQEDSRFVKAKRANKANKEIADYLKNQGIAPYQLEIAAFPNSERLSAEAESNSNKVLAKNIPFDRENIVADLWPSRWRPSGKLTFIDDGFIEEKLRGKQPLVKVRVTAGYGFYWRESKTDENGEFKSPDRWRYSVDYEVNFDSDQFLLQNGHSWYGEDLEIEKNHTRSAWIKTFEGDHAKWCVIWTAAYNYWYGKIYGLLRPRQNKWWTQILEINVYYKNDKDWDEALGMHTNSPYVEYIQVLAYKRSHLDIYGTTIHEISHSSHREHVKHFALLPKILKESYARGVQRYLTMKRYGGWSVSSYDSVYTGLFEDLEDANSTYAKLGVLERTCDRVSGITVPIAEKVLFKSNFLDDFQSYLDSKSIYYTESAYPTAFKSFTWNAFKDSLMKEYPNGTSNGEEEGKTSYTVVAMDALFKYWETGIGTPCPVLSSSSIIPSSSSAILSSSSLAQSSSSTIASPLTDTRDGKVYKTTAIGKQIWMAENLNYNATRSKCYNDNTTNCTTYGRLYNWSTAMALSYSCNFIACSSQIKAKHKGICPIGWHIPSNTDWDKLMRYADGTKGTSSPYDSPTAGKYLKAANGWNDSHNEDKYGFSALPGGYGYSNGFRNAGYNGDWWSATEYDGSNAYRLDLYGGDKAGWEDIDGNRKHDKSNLFSVRCVKD